LLAAFLAVALALPHVRRSVPARVATLLGGAAFLLAATPFIRLPATIGRFDDAFRALPAPANAILFRSRPVVLADLFRGIPVAGARAARDVRVASRTASIYRPLRDGVFPAVIQIYGGAWQRGQPSDFANFAEWLAAHGYVVVAIDYRHAPAARWPAQQGDVRDAMAWVRDHADSLGVDTARVALIGRSAGAQLALVAAYTPAPLHVRGVVSFYGPADLSDAYAHPPHPDPLHIREVEETFIGGPPAQYPDRFVDASPIAHVGQSLPPTLLIYGRRDHIVEARYGARLHDRLVAAGNTAVYLEIPWAEHAFDEVFNGPSSQLALYYTERFLARTLTGDLAPAR
jgi:acetyl esterase/lipase